MEDLDFVSIVVPVLGIPYRILGLKLVKPTRELHCPDDPRGMQKN